MSSSEECDDDLLRALELSRLTYEEEAKRSRQNCGAEDLISFESPEDSKKREKIEQVKRLYSQPNFSSQIGWRTNFSEGCGDSFLNHTQSTNRLQGSFTDPATTHPIQLQLKTPVLENNRALVPFPPLPRFDTIQGPPPPLYPRRSRNGVRSFDDFPTRTPTAPRTEEQFGSESQPTRRNLPVLYPSPQLNLLNTSGSQYDYVNSELYVPYTMLSKHLQNGDLIDLGESTSDQIWKEFDPLFRRTPEKETPILRPLVPNEAPETNDLPYTPAIRVVASKSLSVDENKENHDDKPCSLECILLHSYVPPILEQIRVLKERGRRQLTASSLTFNASTVDYMTTSVRSVKVVISTDYAWPSSLQKTISKICDTSALVEMILTEVLADLLPDSQLRSGVPIENYALKIFGLDECLPPSSTFGHNLYVGQCLLHGKDVKLEISKLSSPDNTSLRSEPVNWEKMKTQFKYSSVLDKEDIENWKIHLQLVMNDYESVFQSTSTLTVSAASNKVKQCVKMLCKMLNSIEPVNLHQSLQKYLLASSVDELKSAKRDFIASLHNFISTYAKSTMSLYRVDPIHPSPTTTTEVLNCKEKLRVMINSMHNLPEEWMRDYSEFYVTVNIYYGTRLIDGHDQCISKTVKHDAFFPYIPMNIYISFAIGLCVCPRETKVMMILSGVAHDAPGTSDQTVTDIKRALAYASLPLFNEKSIMRQGQHFVPLTVLKDAVLKPWGPLPLIANEKEAVIIVSLPTYDYEVLFPDVSVETQCVKQDISQLKLESQQYLMDILEAGDRQVLSTDDQEMLWQKRCYLMHQPEALPLVLSSVSDWGYGFLSNVYQILEDWVPLSPVQAMQLLLPQYPDARVRQKAVEWILCASSDFLFNALPQLIEALRFEIFESSSLAVALLSLSYKDRRFAFEIYWQLQQRVDHCADFAFAYRCSLLQTELLERHEQDCLRNEIACQHRLLNYLDSLQADLSREEGDQIKVSFLRSRLGVLDSQLLEHNVRLPIIPSFKCSGVSVKDCSIFNSNAKPLKIVFRGLNSCYSIIHKSGDDMRQDALVLQMVGLMNDIWLSEGLDLKVVLFRCVPVGYRKGMAELVSNCATLCDIQKECGVTGVFKDDVLTKWIQKHNSSEFMYKVAMDNFTRSCAGWCVATYILGIGDRHNDNILVTTAGHVFHIDFGKYMGDWQTAAGFKRDRVPFVFTLEMYHVINGGAEQRESYQTFIDYCCRAFNYIRRSYSILTNVLKIMACSDISGLNIESLAFVEDNLMLELSETDAIIQFTQLIHASLKSAFPRINFFIHTLAQMMTGNASRSNENGLSFVPQLYSLSTESKIKSARVISFEKRFLPQKVYLYKMEITRIGEVVSTVVYRTFDEVHELYVKLRRRFPTVIFSSLSAGTKMRSNVREVAQRRMIEIQTFFQNLFTLSGEIAHCDLVYTFFHIILRDSNIDSFSNTDESTSEDARSQCQIYLKLQFNSLKRQLSIFIGHVKHLAMLPSGQAPDAYVKTYVRPDQQNISKRKTQIVKASQNPTFNKELCYQLGIEGVDCVLTTRVLEVSVWNSGGLMDNHKMYIVYIPLAKLSHKQEDRKRNRVLEGWFSCDKCES